MDQQEADPMALLIAEVPEAQLYILVNSNRTKLAGGSLKLAQIQETKSYFINVDKFCQNIANGTPFVSINRPKGSTFLFPNIDQGLNGIYIPTSEQSEFLLTQLANIIQLIPYEDAMKIQQIRETVEMHCKDIIDLPLEDDSNVVNYIAKGGDVLKSSFQWIGGALASGINKGGDFLNSKINQGEQVQVSEDTKSKYSSVKEKANVALQVSGSILMQLYRPVAQKTKELTSDISNKIDTSDNKFLQQGKQLTTATWGAAGTALSGLGDAFSQVGTSLNQNTRHIIEKKYGQDVTQTFMGNQNDASDQQYQPIIEEPQPQEDNKPKEQAKQEN